MFNVPHCLLFIVGVFSGDIDRKSANQNKSCERAIGQIDSCYLQFVGNTK